MKGELALAFSGAFDRNVVEGLVRAEVPGSGLPTRTNIDHKPRPVVQDWLSASFSRMRRNGTARWEGKHARGFLAFGMREPVKVTRDDTQFTFASVLPLLRTLPFELCSALSPYSSGWKQLPDYEPYGFADSHWAHGWMCAFKGAGHDRLFSRRWLDHGPWYLYRDEAVDLSVVLFHHPGADPETAYQQAKPGHVKLGIGWEAGFIQTGSWPYHHDITGLYDPRTRTLKVVVLGREVPESEMTDAAMYRHEHKDDPEQPVDNVAFVFVDPEEAAAHVHGLWLRELECWAIVDGVERRLDVNYVPPAPRVPEWVKRLKAERGG